MSFWEELKRRKVIRVAIAYAIGAWLLLQLAEVLSELLNLPDSVGPIVVGAVILGFPLVVVMAWVFELTADGLKRDSELAPGERSSGRLINVLVIGLLVVALGYFVWESRFQGGAITADNTAANATARQEAPAEPARIGRSIAVLPFENFSGNPEDSYFADGLSDTLLHQLAQLDELKVIARNSSFQYKGSNRDVREIGEALGVETILEGSVQRSGDRIRIIAQLVRAGDGTHVWSRTFEGSMDDVFGLQDQVATEVVDAFQISLSAEERRQLLRDGTDDPVAYDLLMRALAVEQKRDELVDIRPEDDLRISLLTQAVEQDPEYAEAWAQLANSWNSLAFATDSGADWERYIAEAEVAANTAIALDLDLAMAHNVMGWLAHRRGERLEAERYFRQALELDPNDLSAMAGLSLQIGWEDPEAALALADRSVSIDPKNAITQRQRHFFLRRLGRMDDAIAALQLAIELEPDEGMYDNDLQYLYERLGRPDEGARTATRLLRRSPHSFSGQTAMAESWLSATDFERAGQWTRLLLAERPESDAVRLLEVRRLLIARQHEDALELLDTFDDNRSSEWGVYMLRASTCLALERLECAENQMLKQQAVFEDYALKGRPLGPIIALSSLFERLIGERAGDEIDQTGLEQIFLLLEADSLLNTAYYGMAGVLSRLGRRDEAFARLELAIGDDGLLNIDIFGFTPEHSRLLDPLRDDPAFEGWMQRYEGHRDALLEHMSRMEASGELLSPASIDRISGP